MNKETHTSQEFSKKLYEAGCSLKSNAEWDVTMGGEYILCSSDGIKASYCRAKPIYPAYDILNDICVKYAKEFFGTEMLAHGWMNLPDEQMPEFLLHSFQIMHLLQQNKKQEAEDYIWKHCKFNSKDS